MKAFVVCAALLASANAGLSPSALESALRSKWSSYKAEHGKAYHPSEEQHRLMTYMENGRMIDEHNARFHKGLESFEMGHNDMSDLTLEEIMNTRMGLKVPENVDELYANASLHHAPSDAPVPQVVDWRSQGCVQHVKNQGSCGSCYTFSAIGALETAHCIKHNRQLHDLSEQHLVDCAGRGCSGGWMHDMFDFLRRDGGSILQNDYRYSARVEGCRSGGKNRPVTVNSHRMIPRGNEGALMQALSQVGTISIAYNAGTQAHAYYRGGILDVPGCGNQPTHAVLLVGYGSEGGRDYWIIKNSWGTGWGEGGYFRMARGKNMCGIADWASYPIAN